jgi:hypothetical protein
MLQVLRYAADGIWFEVLLGDETEDLGETVGLVHVELEVRDGIGLETFCGQDYRELLAGHR